MKVKDPRYDYHITVAVNFVLENDNKLLIVKRPDTWEWAAGRWSFVGGKIYKNETFEDCIKRKTKQELGFEVQPKGLYKIKQIIFKDKQAYMYIFIGTYQGQKITGEMIDYKWVGLEEIKSMKNNEFSEYYLQEMIIKYLKGNKKIFPLSHLESRNYNQMTDIKSYKEWVKNIVNKNFNPEKIDDYKKWKSRNSR